MELGFSLGTNLGDRLAFLSAAKRELLKVPGTKLAACSSVYETAPVDVSAEFASLKFLNCVVILDSGIHSKGWLDRIHAIETAMGRVRTGDRNAPRPIDIDILYAGDEIIDSGGLRVPHPRWAARRFVVQPLAEVRPGLVIPGAGRSVQEIFRQLPEDGQETVLFAKEW